MALFGTAGSVVSRALVELDIDAHQFDRKLDEADARLREHGNVVSKTLKASYMAGAAGVAVLTAGLAASAKAAVDAQAVRAREQAQLKALKISYTAHRVEIDRNIESLRNMSGFTDEDLLNSFNRLVATTHNVTGAQHDMAIAVDVARARHISLETATQLVTKASIGQVGALRRMGIDVVAVKDAQNKLTAEHIKATPALRAQAKQIDQAATAHRALGLLQQRYAGQAKAYGQTTAGSYDRMRASVRALEVRVGTGLLPTLSRLAEWLIKIVDRLSKSKRAHEDVNKVVDVARQIWDKLVATLKIAWGLLSGGVALIGGVKNAVITLLAAMAIGKVGSFFSSMIGGWKSAGRQAVISAKMVEGASREEATAYAIAMGEMEVATIGLGATIKAALITTGIGAVVVAAGIAVELIITHWSKIKRLFWEVGAYVRKTFAAVWKWLETTALKTALAVVEPFSHLPGSMGKWARKAKDAMHAELDRINQDSAAVATKTGEEYGRNLYNAATPWFAKLRGAAGSAMQTITGASGGASGATGAPGAGGNSVRGGFSKGVGSFAQASIVSTAKTQIGIPYLKGGPAALGKHTDCSGLAVAVLRQNGISVSGRTTWDLVKQGTAVTWQTLQAGDLVFFNIPEDGGTPPQHVGIYIGGGLMIHDPHTGASVETVNLNNSYWRARYYAARRYVKTAQRKTGGSGGGGASGGAGTGDTSGAGATTGSSSSFNAAAAAAPRGGSTAAGNKIAGVPAVDAVKRQLNRDYGDLALLHQAGLDAVIKKIRPTLNTIRGELGKPITNKELALARNQLNNLGSTINAGITRAKAIIQGRRNEFERAWADFANKAMTAFDRVTAQHVAKMQSDVAKAIQQMSVTVNGPNGAFQYAAGQLTPAQQALKDMQDTRDENARQKAIADARKAVAAAPDDVQAQQQLDQALYDEQAAQLQKTADQEQAAADKALQAAQDAAQSLADQQTQDYQDQRDIQRAALQQQLDDLQTHLEARKAKFADANQILADLMAAGGADVGNSFVQGLKDALAQAGIDLSTYTGAASGGASSSATKPKTMTRAQLNSLDPAIRNVVVNQTLNFPDDRPAEPAARAAKHAAGRVWAV